jgi:hypothetical protein
LRSHANLCAVPIFMVRYVLIEGPLGCGCCRSIFTSSSIRALLFTVEQLGGIFAVTLFFSATGGAQAKRQARMDCESANLAETLGRLIAIATASVFIGGIPGSIFGSLQTRGPKVCNTPEERERQLKIWRNQDRLIWVLGLLYCLFCVNLVVLFYANVSTDNIMEWIITTLMALAQDHVVMPLLLVLFSSGLTMLFVAIVAKCKGLKRFELVKQYLPADEDEENKVEAFDNTDAEKPEVDETKMLQKGCDVENPSMDLKVPGSPEETFKLGKYRIVYVYDLPVNSDISRESKVMGMVGKGSSVEVLEIAVADDRVRGRIAGEPAGWICIQHLKHPPTVYAKMVEGQTLAAPSPSSESLRVAGAAADIPALRPPELPDRPGSRADSMQVPVTAPMVLPLPGSLSDIEDLSVQHPQPKDGTTDPPDASQGG